MVIQEKKFSVRKQRIGVVVSNKAQKTVSVKVSRRVQHPLYRKFVLKTTKFMAHDEKEECMIGDKVMLMETKPLSKRKRWRVVKIVRPQNTLQVEEKTQSHD